MKVASVFSGIGSFEHSLKRNNISHKILFACDNDKFCKKNYNSNYEVEKWYDDIKDIDGNGYKDQIDLLVGGCPCQAFSMAGLRKGLKDSRGQLLLDYINLIKTSQPKVFIFENVKGLLNHDKGKTFKWLLKEFQKCGYKIEHKVISAKEIGFPQSRQRIFVIGYKKDLPRAFKNVLEQIKSKEVLTYNLIDCLDDIKDIDEKYYITNDKWQSLICNPSKLDKQKTNINGDYIICQTARQYASWSGNFIVEMKHNANFPYNNIFKEYLKKSKLVPIRYDGEKYDYEYILKNSILRRLTPNECLKLMGYDTNIFKNVCSDFQIYKQCGNSIVVNMFDEIFTHLLPL